MSGYYCCKKRDGVSSYDDPQSSDSTNFSRATLSVIWHTGYGMCLLA